MIGARHIDRVRFPGGSNPFEKQSCDAQRREHEGNQGKRLAREDKLLTALQQHRAELVLVRRTALLTRVQLDLVQTH